MRRTSAISSALIPAIAAFALIGCTASDPAAPSASAPPSDSAAPTGSESKALAPDALPEGMGSGEADGVFPRTLTHFGGKTTIEAEPKRIVILGTGQLDVLATFGIAPVGAATSKDADVAPAYLLEAYPEQSDALGSIASVGIRTEPSKEAMLALDPDLIILNDRQTRESTLAEDAKSIAATVVTEGTGLNWKQDMLLVADALGKTEAARAWLDDYQVRAAAVGKKLGSDTAVSVARKSDDRLRVYGMASFSGSILFDAGLGRPESQQVEKTSIDISEEQLTLADGDWLFYGVQGEQDTIAEIPVWPKLKVVAANRAVRVDDEAWFLNAGPTAANVVLDDLEATLGK